MENILYIIIILLIVLNLLILIKKINRIKDLTIRLDILEQKVDTTNKKLVNKLNKQYTEVLTRIIKLEPEKEKHISEYYVDAKAVVIKAGKATATLLQRRLRVSYSKAANLLDYLEAEEIIGPAEGPNPRKIKSYKK